MLDLLATRTCQLLIRLGLFMKKVMKFILMMSYKKPILTVQNVRNNIYQCLSYALKRRRSLL